MVISIVGFSFVNLLAAQYYRQYCDYQKAYCFETFKFCHHSMSTILVPINNTVVVS